MGTRLGGRYQLIREIGAGGMGRVFQAVDTDTGKTVAAKVMIASGQDSLDALLRFYQEGAVLATLKHPNIVEVYGTFLEEETCCIIMELLEGRSLGRLLKSGQQASRQGVGQLQELGHPQGLPLPRIKGIAQQVTSALSYAHSRGIVHRDIKPDNIMLVANDLVKVTDFGIARILRDGATLNTMTGTSIGTPLYMAPEQIEGQKVDGRADIYSLGAVIYEMVTGQPPFTGTDPLTIAFAHVHRAPQPPTTINQDIPPAWEALILKMLAKDPADRFQTAAALEEGIAALPTGQAGVAPVPEQAPEQTGLDRRATSPPAPEISRPATPARIAVDTAGRTAAVPDEPATPDGGVHAEPAPEPPAPTPRKGATPWPIIGGGAAAVLIALIVVFFVLRSQSSSSNNMGAFTVFGSKGTGAGQFINPVGVTLDPQGNVYVADAGNNRIQKLSSKGKPLAQWGTHGSGPGQFNNPAAVAVDTQGNVFVADVGNNRIQELSPTSEPMAQWGTKGSGSGQFQTPASVAVDPQGNIYVADAGNDRIVKLSLEGAPLGVWGTKGSAPGQFNNPLGIAVDPQGNIYVADAGNSRIQKLSPTGNPLAQWGTRGTGAGQFTTPGGIALDPQGDIYVADIGANRVQELSPTGSPLAQWGTEGSGPGQFSSPRGVAVDSQGTIYVADTGNDRIQKISPSHSNG